MEVETTTWHYTWKLCLYLVGTGIEEEKDGNLNMKSTRLCIHKSNSFLTLSNLNMLTWSKWRICPARWSKRGRHSLTKGICTRFFPLYICLSIVRAKCCLLILLQKWMTMLKSTWRFSSKLTRLQSCVDFLGCASDFSLGLIPYCMKTVVSFYNLVDSMYAWLNLRVDRDSKHYVTEVRSYQIAFVHRSLRRRLVLLGSVMP